MKVAVRNDLGETLATVELKPKKFSTGSSGEHGNFKVENNGRRYQVNVLAGKNRLKEKELISANKQPVR